MKRLNESLKRRGYETWLDLERIQGSTIDAMADGVDGAAVVLFAVSLAYKESSNCRLEAQYSHQADVAMILVMVEANFRACGWLGLLIGTKLWHAFHGAAADEDHAAFERRMEPLCREIGDRGKPSQFSLVPEAVPPTPGRQSASYSPSIQASPTDLGSPMMQQQQHAVVDHVGASGAVQVSSMGEMMSFFERQQIQMERRMQQQQDDFRRERKEMEAKFAAMEMSPTFRKKEAISDGQLAKLQVRVGALHGSGQLSDEEGFTIEDLCGDYVELQAAVGVVTPEMLAVTCGTRQWHTFASVGRLQAVVMLSEKLASDETFCRQLRRKLVVV